MDKKALAHELALKYSFETFDFKNSSPIEFLKYYQSNYKEIHSEIELPEGFKKIKPNPRVITTP